MLQDILERYLEIYPEESEKLFLLQQQVANSEKLNDRKNFTGHIAGSAIILSPDKAQILLIHHRAYDKWMQPGGHWESDEESDPLQTARREVQEETGVSDLEYVPVDTKNQLVPFDLDTHYIAPRPEKDEPEHYHHDFRYLFTSKTTDLTPQQSEVFGAKWFDIDAPETKFVIQIIQKLRARGIVQA